MNLHLPCLVLCLALNVLFSRGTTPPPPTEFELARAHTHTRPPQPLKVLIIHGVSLASPGRRRHVSFSLSLSVSARSLALYYLDVQGLREGVVRRTTRMPRPARGAGSDD